MTKIKTPKILFYDIETLPLKAVIWQPGKQYVGHKQLLPGFEMWDLICIQYCYNDNKPTKVLRFDKHGGTAGVISKFDELVKEADHIIGKNSDRFDRKMLNSLRIFNNLPPMPEWMHYSDDLEKQMRKYLRLPSQSLDYMSSMCGIGGKNKMEMQDWINIQNYRHLLELEKAGLDAKSLSIVSLNLFHKSPREVRKEGKESLDKMCGYGAKDTEDTRKLWYYLEKHFEPRFNMSVYLGVKHACIISSCGSTNLIKNGTRQKGKTRYQAFICKDCGYTGNKAPISKIKQTIGQMG